MPHSLDYSQYRNSIPKPPAWFAPGPPRKPIVCDCGERAGHALHNTYYCPACRIYTRVYPRVGRVQWPQAEFEQSFPEVLTLSHRIAASSRLESENPQEY